MAITHETAQLSTAQLSEGARDGMSGRGVVAMGALGRDETVVEGAREGTGTRTREAA